MAVRSTCRRNSSFWLPAELKMHVCCWHRTKFKPQGWAIKTTWWDDSSWITHGSCRAAFASRSNGRSTSYTISNTITKTRQWPRMGHALLLSLHSNRQCWRRSVCSMRVSGFRRFSTGKARPVHRRFIAANRRRSKKISRDGAWARMWLR